MDNLKNSVKQASSEVDIKEYMVESIEESDFTLGQLLSSMNYTEEPNDSSSEANTSTAMVVTNVNNTTTSVVPTTNNQPILMSSEATKLEKSYNSKSSLDDDFEIARKNIINIE